MKKKFATYIVIFLIFTFGFILRSFSLQDEKHIVTISPKSAADLIAQSRAKNDFVIVDIRTPGEFKTGHLADSILIDFYSKTFVDKVNQLDKTKTYLIYCRSGNRSGRSLELFKKLKFQKVYHMASGINGWKLEGLPVIK